MSEPLQLQEAVLADADLGARALELNGMGHILQARAGFLALILLCSYCTRGVRDR